jgi:hypothetical protein
MPILILLSAISHLPVKNFAVIITQQKKTVNFMAVFIRELFHNQNGTGGFQCHLARNAADEQVGQHPPCPWNP